MRGATSFVAIAILICFIDVVEVQAASFSLTSGTIHAQASATPATFLNGSTVNSQPPDIVLGGSTTSGTVPAVAKTNFNSSGDAIGSFTAGGSFTAKSVSFNLSGASQGNGGQASAFGSASGSGSVDILFTLDSQALVQFLNSSGFSSPYYTGNYSLKLNGTSVASLTGGDVLFTQTLNPGSYELAASGDIHPAAGTGGGEIESLSITILPEPTMGLILMVACTICGRPKGNHSEAGK